MQGPDNAELKLMIFSRGMGLAHVNNPVLRHFRKNFSKITGLADNNSPGRLVKDKDHALVGWSSCFPLNPAVNKFQVTVFTVMGQEADNPADLFFISG